MEKAGVPLEKIQKFRVWQVNTFDYEAYDPNLVRDIMTTGFSIQETVQREAFLKKQIEKLEQQENPLTPETEKQIQRLRDEILDQKRKYYSFHQSWCASMSSCRSGPLRRAFIAYRTGQECDAKRQVWSDRKKTVCHSTLECASGQKEKVRGTFAISSVHPRNSYSDGMAQPCLAGLCLTHVCWRARTLAQVWFVAGHTESIFICS